MFKLPEYYDGIVEIDALMNVLKEENLDIKKLLERLKNELMIVNSNNEGLKIWADTLNTSEDKTEILTKLRGVKTITKINLALMIKSLLKIDSKVEITELYDQYKILAGIHNINNQSLEIIQRELQDQLRLIIPSHLELILYFNSMIWKVFDKYNKTWRVWDNLNLSWNSFENYNEGIGG